MSVSPKIPALIHLEGPPGSGKTTLCRLLLNALSERAVLAVDASSDGYLALSYGLQSPFTLEQLLARLENSPTSRESMDWVLQDLPIAVAAESDADILQLGRQPQALSPLVSDLLAYGLPRLISNYEIVIWDGPLGIYAPFLKGIDIRSLVVITPQDDAACREMPPHNAMLLLSKAQPSDALPPEASRRIQAGEWKFVGKLPPLTSAEQRARELPRYFQDCYHKLDLPFTLRPR